MTTTIYCAVYFALAVFNFDMIAAKGSCRNIYEDYSCEMFKARSLCKMFRKYCEMTCGVCDPPTTIPPRTSTSSGSSYYWVARGTPPTTVIPKTTEKPIPWSRCTRKCGTGTQYQFLSRSCKNANNPKCERRFRECNVKPCVFDFCFGKRESRYGHHKCCNTNGPAKNNMVQRFNKALNMDNVGVGNYWPWMVLVTAFSDVCSGVLIHKQWVIVPAYCVSAGGVKINPRRISVYIGIKKISDATARTLYSVKKSLVYPKNKNFQDDIALLQLQRTRNARVAAVLSLPRAETAPIDGACVVAGWGLSGNLNSSVGFTPLESATQRKLDFGICRNQYKNDPVFGRYMSRRSPKLLCAGSLSERNPICNGYVGSAMFCQRCSSCEWYLAGVSTISRKGSCDKRGYPTLFTRIRSYEPWIYKHIPDLQGKRLRCPYKYSP